MLLFFRKSKSKPDEKKQEESKSSRRSRQTVNMDIEPSIIDTAAKDDVTADSNQINETVEAPTATEVPDNRSKRKRKISFAEDIQEDANNSIVAPDENSRKRGRRPAKNPPPIPDGGVDMQDDNTKSKKRNSEDAVTDIINQTELNDIKKNKQRRSRQLNEDTNKETNDNIDESEANKNKSRRSRQLVEDNTNEVINQTDESEESSKNKPRRSRQLTEDNTLEEFNNVTEESEDNTKNKPRRSRQLTEDNTKEVNNEKEESGEIKKSKSRRGRRLTEDNTKEITNQTDEPAEHNKPRRSRESSQVIPEISKNGSVSEPEAENKTEEELPKRRGRPVSEKRPVQVNSKSKKSDKSNAEVDTHEPAQVDEEEPQAEEEYEIEKILDKKGSGKKTMYLVKWKGYDKEEDNTWEPVSSLQENLPFIEEFERIRNAVPVMEGIKRLPTSEVKKEKKSRGAPKKNKDKEVVVEEKAIRNEEPATASKNIEVKTNLFLTFIIIFLVLRV